MQNSSVSEGPGRSAQELGASGGQSALLHARGLGFAQKSGHQPSRFGRQVGFGLPSGHNLRRTTRAEQHAKTGHRCPSSSRARPMGFQRALWGRLPVPIGSRATGSRRPSVCPSSASHGSREFQEITVTHRALTPAIKWATPPTHLQEQALALRQCAVDLCQGADAGGRALSSPSQPSRPGLGTARCAQHQGLVVGEPALTLHCPALEPGCSGTLCGLPHGAIVKTNVSKEREELWRL